MKKLLFYMLSIVAFVACSDDNNGQNELSFDKSKLLGEWVSSNSSGSVYVDLQLFSSNKAIYQILESRIDNLPSFIEDVGSWSWYSDRQMLGFNFVHHKLPFNEIMELTDTKMVLRNISFNTQETYFRVVETIEVNAGQSVEINYVHDHAESVEIYTDNSDLVQVSDDGIVTGIYDGVAFVAVETENQLVYVKVIVKSRTTRFSEEIKLHSDDIIAKYGEPNLHVELSATQMAMQYLFPKTVDSELYALQYRYHKETHEIYLIQTIYTAEKSFYQDWLYIDSKYFLQDTPTHNVYGEHENFFDNSYTIIVVGLSGGLYWINYQNLDYVD